MFWEKKKHAVPVGAIDKIAVAKRMREASQENMRLKGGKAPTQSQTMPVTIIFVLAVVLAMLLTDGSSSPLSGWHPTGIYYIDHLLTSSDIPPMTGDRDMDRLAVILIRGGAFFLFTSLIPFVAFLSTRVFGKEKLNPLVACWGVSVLGLLVFLFLPVSDLLQMIGDLVGGLHG